MGETCVVGVSVGDGVEAARGGDVLTGGIVEVGREAIPQNCESSSCFDAEYSVDSVEKFPGMAGWLTVPSGHA